eukprot:TRINITY_DN14944_c0_g1_i1.p1 TRINITY_DN14944_c0_g1~~TRINITY_DN14944_c0_g1_i1.p1  ORF type:complete len:660 (+),score=73.66 TRINITY_DN14944_c0_g1_i1:83-2062(+)
MHWLFALLFALTQSARISKQENGPTGDTSVATDAETMDTAEQEDIVIPKYQRHSDPNRIWTGWGVSLCWWANGFGSDELLADPLADLAFTLKDEVFLPLRGKAHPGFNTETLPGLGLTVVRYNVGGSSDTPNVQGDAMVRGKGFGPKEESNARVMEGFWLNAANATDDLDPVTLNPLSEHWDWSRDASQIAMLKKSKERGANTFELFSNSPMWWMLYSKNTAGRECDKWNVAGLFACISTKDNLRIDMHHAFAHYLTEVWKHAADSWGVEFQTIEPFNEPRSNWWHKDNGQEGCHFKTSTQAHVLKVLYEVMKAKGILGRAEIAASDENSLAGDDPILKHHNIFNKAIHSWRKIQIEGASAHVAQVNVHSYNWQYYNLNFRMGRAVDDGEATNADSIQVRDSFRRAVPFKRRWMSEYGRGAMAAGYSSSTDDFEGLQLARVIILDLKWLRPGAWAVWQLIDPSTSWGLIKGDPTKRTLDGATTGYFVFAQFSRHIRPGMLMMTTTRKSARLGAREGSVDPEMNDDMTLVALDEERRRVVIVVGPKWDQRPGSTTDTGARLRGNVARRVSFELARLRPESGASAAVWCTYTGDTVVDRSQKSDPVDEHFSMDPSAYAKWRSTKYKRVDDVALERTTLSVHVPAFTVCTYEVQLKPALLKL